MSTAPDTAQAQKTVEYVSPDGEILDFQGNADLLSRILRVEKETHVQTAHAYPRKVEKFVERCKAIIEMDVEIAEDCTYTLPGYKNSKELDPKTNKPIRERITGPSVRLAEIMLACWGNLDVTLSMDSDDGQYVTASAVVIDAEVNNRVRLSTKRRIVDSNGRRYSVDNIKNAWLAAQSIAKREAIFNVIPRASVNLLWRHSQKVAAGDVKSLPERTAKALEWFSKRGVTDLEVWQALGITNADAMTMDLLTELNGMRVSIREGDATLDELFRPKRLFPGNVTGATPEAGAPPTGNRAADLATKLGATLTTPPVAPTPATPPPVAPEPAPAATADVPPVPAPQAPPEPAQKPAEPTPEKRPPAKGKTGQGTLMDTPSARSMYGPGAD